MEYAEWFFHAHGYDKGSTISRLTQWKQVQKSSGFMPEGLRHEPKLSDAAAYYWILYLELKSGSDAVTYTELVAFQTITGHHLSPWAASVLIIIDKIRLSSK